MCSSSGGSKNLVEKKQVFSTFNSSTNKYQWNWNCNLPFFFSWVSLLKPCLFANPTGQTNSLSQKIEKSETRRSHFQVIISPAFPYWKPILSDWFSRETCQFSFIFQFATASVQGPPPLLNHKKAVFLAAALHANCKPMICPPNQPCDVLIRCRIVTM